MLENIDNDFLANVRARAPDFGPEANIGLPKGAFKCGNGLVAAELAHIWDLEMRLFLSAGIKIFQRADDFGHFFTQSHWPIICLGDNHSNHNFFPPSKLLLIEGFVWPLGVAFCRSESTGGRLLFYRSWVDGKTAGSAPDPILYYQGDAGAGLAADFLAAYYNLVMLAVLARPNQKQLKRRTV